MPSLIPARETAKTKRFSPFIMIYYSKFLSLVVTHGPSVVTPAWSFVVNRGPLLEQIHLLLHTC